MATLKLHSAAFDEQLARKLDETTDWLMHNMIDKHDGTSAPDTSKRTTSPDDGSLPEGIPNESTPANKLSTVSFAIRELDGTISVRPNHRASGLIESRFRPGVVLAQRYCLEREIGRGGMGIVYLAMDSLLERTVAVKVVLPLLGGLAREGQSANETIADEAKIGAKLAHPNIAQVYDFGVFAECPFAVFVR